MTVDEGFHCFITCKTFSREGLVNSPIDAAFYLLLIEYANKTFSLHCFSAEQMLTLQIMFFIQTTSEISDSLWKKKCCPELHDIITFTRLVKASRTQHLKFLLFYS